MIIDCHSHIWTNRQELAQAVEFSSLAGDDSLGPMPEEHLASSAPAAMTFVLGFVSEHLGARIPNDLIRDHVAANADRMLAFAGVDPMADGCLSEVERLTADGQFAGLTVSPACQGFHPCDTRAMRLYQLAEKLALPVIFLGGMVLPRRAVLEYSQPTLLDEVARTFGDLKMVITHMGHPWLEQTIALIAKHENVFANTAGLAGGGWLAYRSLGLAHETGVIDKLLFASGFPEHNVKQAVEAVYNVNKLTVESVLPAVPREQLRQIVERDSLKLLGLSNPALPSS